jgi:malonyl-CoA O-methyltransferase
MSSTKSGSSEIEEAPTEASLDADAARRAFDKAARNGAQWDLSDEIARRMAARLDYVRLAPTQILDAGCGPETETLLAKRYPAAQLTGVDASLGMTATLGRKSWISRLGRKLGAEFGRSRMVCGDICALPIADSSMDLVWSNLALAWAPDASRVFLECQRVLKDGGLLMFSSYGPDTLRELKTAFSRVDDRPHVHEFADMHDLGDKLVASGFADPVMDMDKIIYAYVDVASLARELKRSGQTNVMADRRRGLMSPAAWNAMSTAYPHRPLDGRIEATFEIVYGHAWKSGGKPRAGKSTDGIATIQWLPERGNKT